MDKKEAAMASGAAHEGAKGQIRAVRYNKKAG